MRSRPLAAVSAGIVLVIGLNTVTQVRLNAWYGAFYGALERRDFGAFLEQLGIFLVLAGILLVFVVGQTFLQEVAKVRLRERVTRSLLDRWLLPRRAFELNLAGDVGQNPDQRLQEDVKHLSELGVGLAAGLVQHMLLLLTFVGVLWALSTPVPMTLFGTTIVIHGLMLWGTLLFSLAGSALTYIVGAPLVRLHQQRYAREAELRFAIVRVSESAQEIAFYRGEGRERASIDALFNRVAAVMMGLAGATARVTWVTSGYGWLVIVAPVVVAAPAYFAGDLNFGQLMMVVGAFHQVQQSLRWFVDNYATIADWRATRRRVTEFSRAVDSVDVVRDEDERIAVLPSPTGNLVFDHVRVRLQTGVAVFDHEVETIRQGERVLIIGEHGAGKGMLFRAMAGLWPWGEGAILVPPQEDVMFLSQKPYLPLGSLRAALAYPGSATRWDDAAMMTALSRVGLADLAASLDVVKRWDRELTIEQQERLTFARILLHRPRWLLLDEATSASIIDDRHKMLAVLNEELADISVIGLARTPSTDGLYDRMIHLRRLPGESSERVAQKPPPPDVTPASPRAAPALARRPADLVGAKP
jgi:putative ATP-binding cassette transporter